MKKLTKIVLISIFVLSFTSCSKDRYEFTMKYIKLNSYHKSLYPDQNLFLKIVDANNANTVLAQTESYPSTLPLPATFALHSHLRIHLYKEHLAIQLWGDSTGLIAASTINMDEYKIIFPIEMETENENVSFSVMGSWK